MRVWSGGSVRPLWATAGWVAAVRPDRVLGRGGSERRTVVLDLVVASVSLSMVAVLQNVDVLVVGRDNPSHSGAYAAVSVTSKAIVFGAIVLGGYLLPEAAIRWRQGATRFGSWPSCSCCSACPRCCCSALRWRRRQALLELVFHHAYTSGLRRAARRSSWP